MCRPPVSRPRSYPPGRRPCRPDGQGTGGLLLLALAGVVACGGRDPRRGMPETAGAIQGAAASSTRDEGLPRMLNPEPPFRYPPALYAQRVQGNVVLRLFIDELGQVVPESTQVMEPSGYAPLDSAAVRGSESLRFAPARRGGQPVAAPMLFPVHFRHPKAEPLPGDTTLPRP